FETVARWLAAFALYADLFAALAFSGAGTFAVGSRLGLGRRPFIRRHAAWSSGVKCGDTDHGVHGDRVRLSTHRVRVFHQSLRDCGGPSARGPEIRKNIEAVHARKRNSRRVAVVARWSRF